MANSQILAQTDWPGQSGQGGAVPGPTGTGRADANRSLIMNSPPTGQRPINLVAGYSGKTRDDVLRRLLNIPPTPHKPVGKHQKPEVEMDAKDAFPLAVRTENSDLSALVMQPAHQDMRHDASDPLNRDFLPRAADV